MIESLLLTATLGAAPAFDPPRVIAQYTVQRWTEESAIPVTPLSLGQGKDGFMWVGFGEAIHRFDGVRFEKIDVEDSNERHGNASVLRSLRNGDIWTFFAISKRFAVYRDGALRLIEGPSTPITGTVTSIEETRDGAIWALPSAPQGVFRYKDGQWRQFGVDDGVPRDYSFGMLVAADGSLWISYYHSIVRLAPGAARFETVLDQPEGAKVGRIAQDAAGRIWFSGKLGTYPLTGPGAQGVAPAVRFPYRTAAPPIPGRPLFDREGNLWLALPFGGLQYVARPDPAGAASEEEARSRVESFGVREGLPSNTTSQLLEDREGNVWVATEKGIIKFRAATIRLEPRLTNIPPYGDIVMAASDGSVYVGEADAVYRVAPNGSPERILTLKNDTQAMCEAPDGAVWIFSDVVSIWKEGRLRGEAKRPPVDTNIHDCAFDRNGDVWATARARGMHRYRNGAWEAMFGASDKDFIPSYMVRDARGRLVLVWGPRTLAWIDAGERTSISLGEKPEAVLGLHASPNGDVLTMSSIAFRQFRDGRMRSIAPSQGVHFRGMSGVIEPGDGYTWTTNQVTLARTRSEDIEHAFGEPAFAPTSLKLGFADGLPGRAAAHAGRSMVQGGDGRIWISTIAGTAWIDPQRITRITDPPKVAIASVTVDGKLHRDPKSLKLAPSPANIQIDYSVLSFVNPKAVAFRYQLEGYDTDWIDPGARRQAFYTNLGPGTYRFRVKGASNEGVWNEAGAVVDFEIPPTFVQSKNFIALCVALGVVLLWLLHRLRMAQVGARIRGRLEAQLAERERIARELHDTLLQSVQGLILHFRAAANRLSSGDASRAAVDAALERANDVVAEGRNRVLDLRIAGGKDDLRTVLQDVADAAGLDPGIEVRVAVDGEPRPLHPVVLAEIRQIASEALFNIARHARPKSVDVTATFSSREFRIRIHDDGVGIDEKLLSGGRKPGHFGLLGMRERAERVGGTLSIESRTGSGCTVTLELPARVAFADDKPRRLVRA